MEPARAAVDDAHVLAGFIGRSLDEDADIGLVAQQPAAGETVPVQIKVHAVSRNANGRAGGAFTIEVRGKDIVAGLIDDGSEGVDGRSGLPGNEAEKESRPGGDAGQGGDKVGLSAHNDGSFV